MILLLSLGCVLFDRAAIDCARDEPCADTGEPADSPTETADTAVDPVSTVGVLLSMQDDADAWSLRTWTHAGETELNAGSGVRSGPVWGDDLVGWVGADQQLYRITSSAAQVAASFDEPILHVADGVVATRQGLWDFDGQGLAKMEVVHALIPVSDGVIALERRAEGLTAWKVSGGEVTLLAQDFEPEPLRAVAGFEGPAGVQVCSNAGALFALDDLIAGTGEAEVLCGGSLDDVVACGFDEGLDELVVVSQTKGVLRVDADACTHVEPMPEGGRVQGASFY